MLKYIVSLGDCINLKFILGNYRYLSLYSKAIQFNNVLWSIDWIWNSLFGQEVAIHDPKKFRYGEGRATESWREGANKSHMQHYFQKRLGL